MVQITRQDALFVSDLHLSTERPQINAAFFDFLASHACRAGMLFILGDLFDYWVGDDDLADPLAARITQSLATVSRSSCTVRVMHGNRDFLMRHGFCEAAQATLLPDPSVFDLGGVRTLLLHGDTLCLDDPDYQNFRSKVRTPAWQTDFLSKPLPARQAIALGLRADSRSSQQAKSETIMDVAERAVIDAFRRFDCERMIHGHTHRPARHAHMVDGRMRERWVLADWYAQGSYLHCDASGRCTPLALHGT
jgi:UDP-2,3-diacylglucosamine hydrolase